PSYAVHIWGARGVAGTPRLRTDPGRCRGRVSAIHSAAVVVLGRIFASHSRCPVQCATVSPPWPEDWLDDRIFTSHARPAPGEQREGRFPARLQCVTGGRGSRPPGAFHAL